jgi:hypothetical protein
MGGTRVSYLHSTSTMSDDRGTRLLASFFAPPNDLELAAVSPDGDEAGGSANRLLKQLIDDVQAGDGRPVLLPRASADATTWYVLLDNPALRRIIVEDIRAFVGATHGDLNSLFVPLTAADPIDAAVLDWLGTAGASMRFRVPAGHRAGAFKAIAAMRRAWEERPRHLVVSSDATGLMLRTLNRAIAAEDAGLAEAMLDRLRASGRLSSANATFATIRVLALAKRWTDILGLAELGVVLTIPRPRAVTDALLRAVYWAHLADMLPLATTPDSHQAASAVAVAQAVVLPRYGSLFLSVEGIQSEESLLLFGLRAAAATPPRPDEIRAIVGRWPREELSPSVDVLIEYAASAVVAEAPPTAEDLAAEAARRKRRRTTQDHEARLRAVQDALETFAQGLTLDTASAALAQIERLSLQEADELARVNRYQVVLERLAQLKLPGTDVLPRDWLQWSQALRTTPAWSGASHILDLGDLGWDVDVVLSAEAAESFALSLLEARVEGRRDAAAKALDHLLPAVEVASERGLDVSEIGTRLATVLLSDEVITEADWSFICSLVETLFRGGLTAQRYAEMLDDVRDALTTRASPAAIDASLSLLETVAFHHAPDLEARQRLVSATLEIFDRYAHRLHSDQLALIRIACRDLGEVHERRAEELANRLVRESALDPDAETIDLAGQLVGIYSLEESAAARAGAAIQAAYPGVRVALDSSHVATSGLRRLAQTANHMVIATRAAKHAATLEIEEILNKRRLTPVYPAGKGATSILRALRGRLVDGR